MSPPSAPRLLHILNGDSTRLSMERSDIPGTLAVWADVLHEGPVPGDLTPAELAALRRRWHGLAAHEEVDGGGRPHLRWEAGLEAYASHDEVVLWFEHDLFDQLALLHHLDWYSHRALGQTVLSLICIGEFPGAEPFAGLGQLTPNQLALLLGTRQRVSVRQMELARRGWRAFTSNDPEALSHFVARDTSALPFLAGALVRLLEEYPAVGTGLPRTERTILEAARDGITEPARVFTAMQRREERVFMGDSTFWDRVQGLARGDDPLLIVEAEPARGALPRGRLTITDTGRRVLAGELDWVILAGIDRWIGGVHLEGREVPWRWDPTTRQLVRLK